MTTDRFVPLSPAPPSGPFSKDELRIPLLDRWTPLRLILYPVTAAAFWLFLLPCVVLAHLLHRLWSALSSLHIRRRPAPSPSSTPTSSTLSPSSTFPAPAALPATVPLLPSDAVWLHSSPSNHNVITAVLVLSSPLPFSLLLHRISTQLLSSPGMERLRYLPDPTTSLWYLDPTFNLLDHVVTWPHWRSGDPTPGPYPDTDDGGEEEERGKGSEEGSSRALLSLISAVINTPVQSVGGKMSTWSFALLPRYADGCVVVFRAHHVLADGVLLSGVLLEMLMDTQPSPPALSPAPTLPSADTAVTVTDSAPMTAPPPPLQRRREGRSEGLLRWVRLLWAVLVTMMLGPLHLVTLSWHQDDHNPLHHPQGLVSPHKSVGWSFHPISLHRVKRISRFYHCSVNDVMMAVFMSTLQRLAQAKGMTGTAESKWQQRAMHLLVPINIRPLFTSPSTPLTLGNLFSVLILPFPLYFLTPRDRLLQMTRQMNEVKRSVLPLMMFFSLYLSVTLLPPSLSQPLIDMYNDMSTAICTNNRSPATRLSLCGRPLKSWVSWAPCRSGVGMSMTMMSYAGEMRVSVVVDRACGVRGEEVISRYEEEFVRLEDTLPLDFMGEGPEQDEGKRRDGHASPPPAPSLYNT